MRRLGGVLGLAAIAAVYDGAPVSAQQKPGGRTEQISGTVLGSLQDAARRHRAVRLPPHHGHGVKLRPW
jgi:hypothetical protein